MSPLPILPAPEDEENLRLLSSLIGLNAATRLWEEFGSLTAISRESIAVLQKAGGLSRSQATALKTSFKLAQGLVQDSLPHPFHIYHTGDIARLVRERFRLLKTEELHVVLLDGSNHVIRVVVAGPGSPTRTGFSPRGVLHPAVEFQAAAICLAHNHPCANHTPSPGDIRFTRLIHAAAEHLDIRLHDHVVMGLPMRGQAKDYSSFRELKLPPFDTPAAS